MLVNKGNSFVTFHDSANESFPSTRLTGERERQIAEVKSNKGVTY
jgi:hypothetical protein